MKALKIFLYTSLFAVFLLSGTVLFIGKTESGLGLLHNIINRIAPQSVHIEDWHGKLFDEFILTGLSVRLESMNLDVEEINFSWNPLDLFRAKLNLGQIGVRNSRLLLKEDPNEDNTQRESNSVGVNVGPILSVFQVELGEASVESFEVFDASQESLVVIDSILLNATGSKEKILVRDFDLQAPDFGISIKGEIAPLKNWKSELTGGWRLVGYGFHQMTGTYSIAGPLHELSVEAELVTPGHIRVEGTLSNLLSEAEWVATVVASDFDLSTWIQDCPEIVIATFHGDVTGDFANYGGVVESELSWAGFRDLRLTGELDGDGLGILFPRLRVEKNDGFAEANGGAISWEKLFSWKAFLHVEKFNPENLTEVLQGRLDGEFESVGDVTEEGLDASFDIKYINGDLLGIELDLAGRLQLDEDGIYSDNLNIKSGKVQGIARIDNALFKWDDSYSWSIDVTFDDFDPVIVNPQLYGEVNGRLNGAGKWSEDGVIGALTLEDITGDLRGKPLTGSGRLQIYENKFESKGMELSVGNSVLRLAGEVTEEMELEVSFHSPDLFEFLPEARGALDITGRVTGSRQEPQMAIQLSGNKLGYQDQSLESVTGEFHLQKGVEGKLGGKLHAEELNVSGVDVSHATLKLNGTLARHTLNTEIETENIQLQLRVTGEYGENWVGKIQNTKIESLSFGTWLQFGQAEIQVENESVQLGSFCLTEQENHSNGCISLNTFFHEATLWDLAVKIDEFDLRLLDRAELLPYKIDGKLSSRMNLSGSSVALTNGSGWVELPNVELHFVDEEIEEDTFELQNSFFSFEHFQNTLDTYGFLQVQSGGEMRWELKFSDFGNFDMSFGKMGIKGAIDLNRLELTMLGALAHLGVQPKGAMSGSLDASGTFKEPKLIGNLVLEEGGVELIYQGIVLDDIQLSLAATGENTRVRGRIESGEGYLDINGSLGYNQQGGWGELKLTGNNFQLVNLPEYSFKIDPDVVFKFTENRGELTGRVGVPYGLIVPEELNNTVSVSEDVVLVDQPPEVSGNGWPFYLDLKVMLGEDVSIDGYGLSGHLGGDFQVKITPEEFITGLGELDLRDGKFSLYGQSFDIARGRVLFTGGPIDNPGIDVRAQKVVSAEQAKGKGYTVGVDISGLVQDLQFHLFSDPYMDDTEILSHLILGHSLAGSNQAEGNILQAAAASLGLKGGSKLFSRIGDLLLIDDMHLEGNAQDENVSFVVGKKITEDLYIGYDINMFSQLGQFRVRYDLTRGFWVETSSSSESTGADLMYSFER